MHKIDVGSAPPGSGSRYPAPFDEPCKARAWRRLGEAAGLTQFGVNLVRLGPGVWSSQRHWHSHEDEFVYVLEYPDIDLKFTAQRYSGQSQYVHKHKDGRRPY